MQEEQEVVLDLREVLKSLRRHIGMIIICGLVATIFGAVYTFFIATPIYTASSQMLAKLPEAETAAAAQVNSNIQMTNTINDVITSKVILNQVQKNLGLSEAITNKKVTTSNETNSQVITISVTDENPYTAQKIANEITNVFSQQAAEILTINKVTIISEAEVNTNAVSPRPELIIPLSLIIGLTIGAGFVLILESFNNKIVTDAQLSAIGFSVLGSTSYVNLDEFLTEMSGENISSDLGKRSVVRGSVLEKINVNVRSNME
ncbi:MAG: YveK family protein [Lactovum sp.]